MVWDINTSCGNEQDKIASLAVPYLQGKFLDLGCGLSPVWPTAIGIDAGNTFGLRTAGIRGDIADLSMFQNESMDAIFSSHALEDFPREQVPAVLREWARVLKVGGNLVLYVPSANLYPKVGEFGANPAHKWDIYPGDVEAMLKAMATTGSKGSRVGWTLLESEERGGTNEYSLYIVARKEKVGWKEDLYQRNPGGKKRCLVCRFGAIGDQIVASSILPGLQKQGYHVTYMSTPDAQQVLLHDPHIDEWWIQEKDFVPNQQLGPYWASVAERFDRVINLSESIEGALLTLPGRLTHDYPLEVRQKLYAGVNYLERTHDIAGVPYDFEAKFYPTVTELDWALKERAKADPGAAVLICLHGSSVHKVYPWSHFLARWLTEKGVHVWLSGDNREGLQLQNGVMAALEKDGIDLSKIHPVCGKWKIREALTFAQVVDCAVGPETGVMNAVGLSTVPKVIMLSHSSHENLTKHWRNTVVVMPDVSRCSCYPCLRLHYSWDHCVRNEKTGAAQCASSLAPELIFELVMKRLEIRQAA